MSGDVVDIQGRRQRRRIVLTFPFPPSAQNQLSERLGDRVDLVDVRAADGEEDVVLVPSSSRQLIGKISTAFPRALVIVVEVEDPAHGLTLGGHVMRSLDAGADGYYVARSLDQLAGVIDHVIAPQASAQQQPAELAPPQEDELSSILDRLIQPTAATESDESSARHRCT